MDHVKTSVRVKVTQGATHSQENKPTKLVTLSILITCKYSF